MNFFVRVFKVMIFTSAELLAFLDSPELSWWNPLWKMVQISFQGRSHLFESTTFLSESIFRRWVSKVVAPVLSAYSPFEANTIFFFFTSYLSLPFPTSFFTTYSQSALLFLQQMALQGFLLPPNASAWFEPKPVELHQTGTFDGRTPTELQRRGKTNMTLFRTRVFQHPETRDTLRSGI